MVQTRKKSTTVTSTQAAKWKKEKGKEWKITSKQTVQVVNRFLLRLKLKQRVDRFVNFCLLFSFGGCCRHYCVFIYCRSFSFIFFATATTTKMVTFYWHSVFFTVCRLIIVSWDNRNSRNNWQQVSIESEKRFFNFWFYGSLNANNIINKTQFNKKI